MGCLRWSLVDGQVNGKGVLLLYAGRRHRFRDLGRAARDKSSHKYRNDTIAFSFNMFNVPRAQDAGTSERYGTFKIQSRVGWFFSASTGPRKVYQNAWSKNAQNLDHASCQTQVLSKFQIIGLQEPLFDLRFPYRGPSLCLLASSRQQFTTAEGRWSF